MDSLRRLPDTRTRRLRARRRLAGAYADADDVFVVRRLRPSVGLRRPLGDLRRVRFAVALFLDPFGLPRRFAGVGATPAAVARLRPRRGAREPLSNSVMCVAHKSLTAFPPRTLKVTDSSAGLPHTSHVRMTASATC